MDFLERVVAERRADYAGRRRDAAPPTQTASRPSLLPAIRQSRGLAVIAEIKRVSPAAGVLGRDIDPVAQARAYERAGACAISILTEPRHWGGSLDDLANVRRALPATPLLCKDVIVTEQQIADAAAAGASAVLLIAEALTDDELRALMAEARGRGLEPFVEAHEPAAFQRAVRSGARIVGINARNLRDPREIDRDRVRALQVFVRPEQVLVAESGIESADDALALPARADAVLVGSALMRSERPGELIRALVRARAVGAAPTPAAWP